MEQLTKHHKIIPIPCACPVFQLAIFKVVLVGANINKCDMQFVTSKFDPTSL